MKRTLCILFALLLCLQLAPITRATEEPALLVSSAEFCTGNTAQIEVSISNNPGYCNITAEVLYDESALKLTQIEAVNMPSMFAANPDANRIAAAGLTDLKDDTVMFILHFEVLEAGEHTVSLELLSFGNENDEKLTANVTPGKIKARVHDYQTETREADCTVTGALVHTCTACGHSYETDRVPALGHVFDGREDVICNTCGLDTSKPAQPDRPAILQEGSPWLIVLLIVLIVAVLALGIVIIVLLRRKSADSIPLPNLDDIDDDYEDEEDDEEIGKDE